MWKAGRHEMGVGLWVEETVKAVAVWQANGVRLTEVRVTGRDGG